MVTIDIIKNKNNHVFYGPFDESITAWQWNTTCGPGCEHFSAATSTPEQMLLLLPDELKEEFIEEVSKWHCGKNLKKNRP